MSTRALWCVLVAGIVLLGAMHVFRPDQRPGLAAVRTGAFAHARMSSPQSAQAPDSAARLRARLAALPGDSPETLAAMARARGAMLPPGPDWWGTPFDQIHDRMRTAAEQGDMRAAYALGSRYIACEKALRERTPAFILENLEQELDDEESSGYDVHESKGRLSNTRRRFEQELDQYEACASVGAERMQDGMAWLERAGQSGSESARGAYVSAVLGFRSEDRARLISEIERVVESRAQAREWLQQALVAGEEWPLESFNQAYEGSALYPRDPVRRNTFSYVQSLVRGRRSGDFEALWANGPHRYGKELTGAQWDWVEAEGRRIFERYYEDRPVWPNGAPPTRVQQETRERIEQRRAALRAAQRG